MEVEAFSQKISNVLSKGKFIIPDYKREFDWDEKEIILKESKIISTKEVFANCDSWSENEVVKRREKLVDVIFDNIWR